MRKILLFILLITSSSTFAQVTDRTDPVVVLGNIQPTVIAGKRSYPPLTMTDVLQNPPTIKNIEGFTVRRFCISVDNNERMETYGPLCSKGAEYTTEMKDLLNHNSSGAGTVYFEEISAIGPDKRTRSMNSITVKVK